MINDLPTKCYLSTITVTNTSQSFTYKMAAKINRHRYETIITSLSPCVYLIDSNATDDCEIKDRHCSEGKTDGNIYVFTHHNATITSQTLEHVTN